MKENVIAAQLVFEIEHKTDAEFLTIVCAARRMREDDERMTPRLKVSSYELQYHDDLKPFYHFEMKAQASVRNPELYGWQHGFVYDAHEIIHEGAAAHMSKTLRSISNKLAKLDRDEGRPLSFGQYCARVARAIGAREFIETDRDSKRTRYTVGAAASRIDQIGHEWERKHSAEKAA